MEDKYQQALDTLAHINLQVYGSYEDELDTYLTTGETLTPLPAGLCYLDEFKTLQELIDKYSKLEKALDNICEILSEEKDDIKKKLKY